MNENEIMTNEVMNEEPEVIEEKSGIGTGAAMLIGGLIVAGAIAGGKKLKAVWDDHKAKKEAKKTKDPDVVAVAEAKEVEDPEDKE